jgi:hypothetical protein
MKRMTPLRAALFAALALLAAAPARAQEADGDKFVYADFQNSQNGRPVSRRGGRTQLNRYAQNMANAPKLRGAENADPPAPALARVSGDDAAAAFEYELRAPNEWAGAQLEVFGRPEQDGKLPPDDLSGYKFITMRVFAKGPQFIRVELVSRGQGANLESGYPSANFRLSPGFNTYKLKLDTFTQPVWAQRLDLKQDVLKKLTSVVIGVFCEKCKMEAGTVVVDNIAFEK